MSTEDAKIEEQTSELEGADEAEASMTMETDEGAAAEEHEEPDEGESDADGDGNNETEEKAKTSKRRYAPEEKSRLYAKFVNKELGRMYESRILYVGPLKYESLHDERVVAAHKKAQHAIVRLIQTRDPPRFCVLDLVYRTPEDAIEAATSLNGYEVDGWKLQAVIQRNIKDKEKRPYIIYFMDFDEFPRGDADELGDLNLHHSYDRMEKLWAYVENVATTVTEADVQGAIPKCAEVVLPRSEEGRLQGFGYARFSHQEDRDEAVKKSEETKGFEVGPCICRLYVVGSSPQLTEEEREKNRVEQLEKRITNVKAQIEQQRQVNKDLKRRGRQPYRYNRPDPYDDYYPPPNPLIEGLAYALGRGGYGRYDDRDYGYGGGYGGGGGGGGGYGRRGRGGRGRSNRGGW